MHREYAIEPEVVCTWEAIRVFTAYLGWQNGRLVCRYPDNWPKIVLEKAEKAKQKPVERKKIAERLIKWQRDVLIDAVGRDYSVQDRWIVNACTEHDKKPFAAIIARRKMDDRSEVVMADECEDHPLWRACKYFCVSGHDGILY